ncbi:TonB-dependent receptor [Sphingomonas sp. 1P06PA]|uniref:TonB-dependent receptor n=1 Tax=Sphingomonas sp. 1P06PA TaxID=554121 RepID=UPI0039A604E4
MSRALLTLAASIGAIALSQTAQAQDPAAPLAGATPSLDPSLDDQSGEIVVTAQRRSESLQRTPVAVSVVTAETLTERAITTEADLQTVSPGLTVRASQSSNQLNYAIRGQSLDAFSATRPGVLPYVNEVQVGGAGGASAIYDLQSVQVLKGPQGTLFGRNATGGAVLFTTAKPTNELSGYALGRLGNYDLRYVEGAINVPLVDDMVLARASGFYQKRDGYQRDLFKGTRAGNVDRYGLRGSLTLKPAEGIQNDLVVDYLHSDGSSLVGGLYSLNPNGLVPIIALTNFGNAAQFDGIISAFVAGAGGPPNAGAGAAAAYAAANPTLDPGGVASFLNTQRARGPYRVESDGPNSYRGRNLVISNITAIDIGADSQIRNIFGFTNLKNGLFGDIDGVPYGIDDNGLTGNVTNTRQLSDELQIVGKTGALSYVTGVYFSTERNYNLTTSRLLQFPIIASTQINNSRLRNKTYAGYAQGTYDLTEATGIEGLGITAGARYTKEKISIRILPRDISFSDPAAVQATYDPTQSKSYGNLSWTLGLQDQVNTNLLLYAVTRRSYRNGGFNNVVRPVPGLGINGGNGYGIETVTDAELGVKYGAGPTRFSLALYQNWIEDAQRVAYTLVGGSPAAVTVNVPRAKVRGFEVDGQVAPTDWLRIGAAVNYTDAKFTRNLVSVSGGTPVRFGTYPDTPEWSGNVYADASVPISGSLEASFRADAFAQTSTFFSSTGNLNPGTKLPSYEIVNFRVGIADTEAGWSISGLVRNAFKKVYYVGGVALGELFQTNTAVPGEPRVFLVEARFNF